VSPSQLDDPLDVVVIGGAGVDTNVYLGGDDIDWAVESNFTRNVDSAGQAGGYASRLFAQLGKRTGYIGPVGDDSLGQLLRDALARDGVDLAGVFVEAGVLDGFSLPDAVLRGQILARHTCTLVAPKDRLLTRRQLDDRFATVCVRA
jgi:hypothetical protein